MELAWPGTIGALMVAGGRVFNFQAFRCFWSASRQHSYYLGILAVTNTSKYLIIQYHVIKKSQHAGKWVECVELTFPALPL